MKLFKSKKEPQSSEQVAIDWFPVIEIVAERARRFREVEMTTIGFGSIGRVLPYGEYPELILGRVPPFLNDTDPHAYHIGFQADLSNGISDADAFLAWSSIDFQTFNHEDNRYSYGKGFLSLDEFRAAFADALDVLTRFYGVGSTSTVETTGDKVLSELFESHPRMRKCGYLSFAVPLAKATFAPMISNP